MAIEAGRRLSCRREDGAIIGLDCVLGPTESLYANGPFEVWWSRSMYVWDDQLRQRVAEPALYRLVKRVARTKFIVAGLKFPCEVMFVMRSVVAGDDWRVIRDELVEQVDLLVRKEESLK